MSRDQPRSLSPLVSARSPWTREEHTRLENPESDATGPSPLALGLGAHTKLSMNPWHRTALLILIAGAPACSLKEPPASTPFANQQIVEEMKDLQKALGFKDTKNFGRLAERPTAVYRCYFTGKLELPGSYQQLRFVQGDVSGCAIEEQKYDVLFYPAEAIASGSMPVTPALAEASIARLLVVVPHEDFHNQRELRKVPPEVAEAAATLVGFVTASEFANKKYGPRAPLARRLEGEARVFLKKARIVNVYYDKVSALYRSFRERNVTRTQALAEKQKLFVELQQQCAAIIPEPVSFNKCPAAMNNAGLAFDRTYTREYPRVFEGHYSVGGDPHVSLERLKTFLSASPD